MQPNPDDFTIAVIEQAFAMRKADAFQRCTRQIEEWTRRARSVFISVDEWALMVENTKHLKVIFLNHVNKYAPRADEGPTPETMAQRAYRGQDNVISLLEVGKLTTDHERAAREIQMTVEAITAALHARGPRFEKSSSYGNGDFLKNHFAHWWSWRYVPWCQSIETNYPPRSSKMLRAFLQDGLSISAARQLARMSYERAITVLQDALDLYNKIKQDDEDYDPDTSRRLPTSSPDPDQSYR